MMLNSEQSVQEMLEEHRSKLAEAGTHQDPTSGPPVLNPGSAPAAGATPPAPKSALQPPRAGLAKRRMGTMLGVAPQVGGVQPPDAPASTPPPPPDLGSEAGRAGLAGHSLGAGRSEGFAAVPPGAAAVVSPLAAGRTEAFQQVSAPTANPLAAGRTEAFAAVAEAAAAAPARGRTEVFEATSPSPATAVEPADRARTPSQPPESYHPAGVPRIRLRPLDVFLVVVTCGLYGLVLWAQQRHKPD